MPISIAEESRSKYRSIQTIRVRSHSPIGYVPEPYNGHLKTRERALAVVRSVSSWPDCRLDGLRPKADVYAQQGFFFWFGAFPTQLARNKRNKIGGFVKFS